MHDAVSAGADALAAAGGDGTQAIVATTAAKHNLPYACIPAGNRNHFALDLGEVNGRVFVNNVSMGLYAEAVRARGGVRSAADKPTGCRLTPAENEET